MITALKSLFLFCFFKLQDQSSKMYLGFKVGHLVRLNEQTLSFVILVFACAFWMTILIERVSSLINEAFV